MFTIMRENCVNKVNIGVLGGLAERQWLHQRACGSRRQTRRR